LASFSVIVTACNNAAVLPDALRSVEQALDFLRAGGPLRDALGEVVVVDDGSSDGTVAVLNAATASKDFYRVLRRPRPTSPAAARCCSFWTRTTSTCRPTWPTAWRSWPTRRSASPRRGWSYQTPCTPTGPGGLRTAW
jgi:hypothetical protein